MRELQIWLHNLAILFSRAGFYAAFHANCGRCLDFWIAVCFKDVVTLIEDVICGKKCFQTSSFVAVGFGGLIVVIQSNGYFITWKKKN